MAHTLTPISEITPEEREKWEQKCRDEVAPRLGGQEVEVAAVFQRPEPALLFGGFDLLFSLLGRLYDRLTKGLVGRLPGSFLLAVTRDKVHVFEYRQWGSRFEEVQDERAVFGRDKVWLRKTALGLYLYATEHGGTRRIELDGGAVEKSPGAAEVLVALTRQL